MEYQPEIKLQEKLSELLMESDSSGAEVAREIGVSPASISQYRKGETQPSLDKLVALARALDVSLDYLVLGESEEAEEVSVGPIAERMDDSLQEMQIRTAERTALVAHVGRQLSQMLDEEIEKFLSEDSGRHLYAGIITDTETGSLEKHSETTRLILRDFSYNMSPTEIPGSFFATVANNLSRGRKYQYLLAQNANTDWSSIVNDFRTLLIEQTKSETAVRNNCSFKITTAPLLSGYALYHLSEDKLEKDDPILYNYVHENNCVDDDGWFGYLIPPSLGGRGEPVMDKEHLANAIGIFESLWPEAEPV
ncbi:helix-turn-helix domain-containing protein [Halocatena marina]|uniref:Helix-turn-helix domain-containing protein n=1 Tax=Halocatena marina TaxID=2934937 RepID=A0ABD5YGC9_9EURY|nr:helix-turn-helix transcriptional regulator [Halocatena marina]